LLNRHSTVQIFTQTEPLVTEMLVVARWRQWPHCGDNIIRL